MYSGWKEALVPLCDEDTELRTLVSKIGKVASTVFADAVISERTSEANGL
jgi:hypothetical protein